MDYVDNIFDRRGLLEDIYKQIDETAELLNLNKNTVVKLEVRRAEKKQQEEE